jgi:hypothetical protein
MLGLKNIFLFVKKNSPKKLISRQIEQPDTFTRQEYPTKVTFMSRILEKIYLGSKTN